MKTARRLLALLLVLMMAFALVACGGDTPDTDVGGNQGGNEPQGGNQSGEGPSIDEVVDGFVMPDRPTDETEGKTYIIIQHSEIENPFGYSQDSQMGMNIQTRLDEVMETYGCAIEFEQMSYEDSAFASKMQARQFAENGGDMVFANKNAQLRRTLGTGGETSLMVDLLQVTDIINFWDANKWGTITARESMMAGGTFYGVSPALWVDCTPLPYYQVVYNKDLVEAAGATDPQEYWENEEWDRDAMVDVITETTDESAGVWGMTATDYHMVRATFLGTGKLLVNIDGEPAADGSVEWAGGIDSPETIEALTWLKSTLTNYKKCFNNGQNTWTTWESQVPFNEGLCTMAMTRPIDLFGSVVIDADFQFGVTTWASDEVNSLTGYYEQVYSVAIPVFAQNVRHSAFLMADLFEGLEGVETYDDVLAYYSEEYFSSDLDLKCLVREGATLQYSYWPNGTIDGVWSELANNLLSSGSVSSLVKRYAGTIEKDVETHILPNQVELIRWKDKWNID